MALIWQCEPEHAVHWTKAKLHICFRQVDNPAQTMMYARSAALMACTHVLPGTPLWELRKQPIHEYQLTAG